MASVTSRLVPLESNFLVPERHVLRRAVRLRDHGVHPGQVRHPADQPGDDGPPGRDPPAVRATSTRPRPRPTQAEEEFTRADRGRPARGGAHPRGGPRAGCGDHRRDARAGPGRGEPHRRARPRADRGRPQQARSRRCAPRSARSPPRSPAGSSARRSRTTSRQSRVVDRFLADLETQEPPRRPAERGRDARGPRRSRSRELTDELGAAVDGGADGADRRATSCSRVAACSAAEPALRRVADRPVAPAEAKPGLAAAVFGSNLDDARHVAGRRGRRPPLDRAAATWPTRSSTSAWSRWSGRRRGGDGDRLEDELFAFGRLVDDNPELRDALSDPARVGRRQARPWSRALLDGKVAAGDGRRWSSRRSAGATGTRRPRRSTTTARSPPTPQGELRRHWSGSPSRSTTPSETRLGDGARARSTAAPVHLNVVVDPERDRRHPGRDRRRRHRRHHLQPPRRRPPAPRRLTRHATDHQTTDFSRHKRVGTKMTELSIRPEEIRDALQKYVADYQPDGGQQGRGRHRRRGRRRHRPRHRPALGHGQRAARVRGRHPAASP